MSDFDQRVQPIRLFTFDPGLFVGAADSAVIAQGAGAGLWGSGQEALLDGTVNCFEDAASSMRCLMFSMRPEVR